MAALTVDARLSSSHRNVPPFPGSIMRKCREHMRIVRLISGRAASARDDFAAVISSVARPIFAKDEYFAELSCRTVPMYVASNLFRAAIKTFKIYDD